MRFVLFRNHLLTLCLLLLATDRVALAQQTPFYLPVSKAEFPNIETELDRAFFEAGLPLKTTTTDYWHPYQQGLRQGRPGVYLAAPHFSAWAINTHKFVPLLRLADSLSYVVATRRADSSFFEVNDLAGKTVCTHKAPNLDFLLAANALDNSVLNTKQREVSSVINAMREDDKSCDGFAVSAHLFNAHRREYPYQFIRLQQGREYPNYAYLAHPGTNIKTLKALKKFIRSEKVQRLLSPIHQLYSQKPRLVSAKRSDYPQEHHSRLAPYWRR